jgi:hypothetical protein
MTSAQLLRQFEKQGVQSGGTLLLPPSIALQLVAEARLAGVPILGIEGFKVAGKKVHPSLEHILDLSTGGADSWAEAESFLRNRVAPDMRVEVILG